MSQRTDLQLAEIVTAKREEYEPSAVQAAEEELQARGLSASSVISACSITEAPSVPREELPLEKQHILLLVLFPLVFMLAWGFVFSQLTAFRILGKLGLPVLIFCYYAARKWLFDHDYLQRAADFRKWSVYTLYTYIVVLLLAGVLYFWLSK